MLEREILKEILKQWDHLESVEIYHCRPLKAG